MASSNKYFQGILLVKLHKARNLPKMDPMSGKCDAYFKVSCNGSSEETSGVKKKNYNPNFSETLVLKIDQPVETLGDLVFDCWDKDVLSKDDHVGKAVVNLRHYEIKDKWPVKNKYAVVISKKKPHVEKSFIEFFKPKTYEESLLTDKQKKKLSEKKLAKKQKLEELKAKTYIKYSVNFLPGIKIAEQALKASGKFSYNISNEYLGINVSEKLGAGIFLVVEFEKKSIDLHLVSTNPDLTDFVECGFVKPKRDYKVRRQLSKDPNTQFSSNLPKTSNFIDNSAADSASSSSSSSDATPADKPSPLPGLNEDFKRCIDPFGKTPIYSSQKLDDLKCKTNFSKIQFTSSRYEVLLDFPMNSMTKAHGWVGSADYKKAKAMLVGIETDDKKEALYYPIPGKMWKSDDPNATVPKWGVLRSDFDSDNVDRCIFLYEGPAKAGLFVDLEHKQRTKRVERHYKKIKKVKGERVVMSVNVDDIPTPCYQSAVHIRVLKYIGETKTIKLDDILPIFHSLLVEF